MYIENQIVSFLGFFKNFNFWFLDNEHKYYGHWIASGSIGSAILAAYFIDDKKYRVNASTFVDLKPPMRSELPIYKVEEIKKHGRDADRKWVMFKDVSCFVK